MKTILYIIGFLIILSTNETMNLFAQTTTNVNLLTTTFNPSNVTINVGDTVRWFNSSGSHNVNGTTATYPSNPASFGNSTGSNWTFSHKFNTPGTYNYRCDTHFSMGMTGVVTVLGASELSEQEKLAQKILIYPNPAEFNFNIINNSGISFTGFEMFATSGKSILKQPFSSNIDLPELENGIYYLKLSGETNSVTKIVVIE